MAQRHFSFALFRRYKRSNDGATAIEFALLALPFFIVIFAILETFLALIAEQVIANATDTMAKRLQTGQITKTITREEFRRQFCEEASAILSCSETEIKQPSRLHIDLRSVSQFSQLPTSMPLVTHSTGRNLDISQITFAPGGANTINMLRVYYRWPIVTDFIRPLLTNIREEGDMLPSEFLIITTDAYRAEAY